MATPPTATSPPGGEDTAVTTLTIPARPAAVTAGNLAAIGTAAAVVSPLAAAAVAAAPVVVAGAYAYRRWRTGQPAKETTEKTTTVTRTSGSSGGGILGGTGRSGGRPAGHRAGPSSGSSGGGRPRPGPAGSGTRTNRGTGTAGGQAGTGRGQATGSATKTGRWPWTKTGRGQATGGSSGTGASGRRGHGRTTTTGRTTSPRTTGQGTGQATGHRTARPGRVAGAVEAALAGQRQRTARDAAGAALAHARTIRARHPILAAAAAAGIRATRNAHRRAQHRVLAAQGRRPDGTPIRLPGPPGPAPARPGSPPAVKPTVDRPADRGRPEGEPAMSRPPLPAGGGSALLDLTRRYIRDAAALADQAKAGRVGMLRVRDEMYDMPAIMAALTNMLADRADIAQKNLPVDPAVPGLLRRIASTMGGAAIPARQLGETLDMTDYDAYRRLLRPRPGEAMLDVTANQRHA